MGPLQGVRVIEMASLAPAPFGCMVLADLGADVLRVDRPDRSGRQALPPVDPLCRSRRSIRLNLKDPAGVDVLLRLADGADVLVEAFRPGVAERLGFGPDVCAQRNPRLIYARMTGWGQDGPLADTAGHDIDYIAVSGSSRPHRPGRRAAAPAAEPDRGLRRRRDAARRRRARRPAGARALRAGPGRGRRHGRRLGAARLVPVRAAGGRGVAGRAGHERARRRGPVLRHVRHRGRPAHGRGRAGTEVLRRAAGPARARRGRPARPVRPLRLAGAAGAAGRGVRRAHTGANGWRSSRGRTPAWPRWSARGTRPATRTTPPGARSSRWAG